MEFPCFMYHAVFGGRVFHTSEALQEAGDGWFDTPAKLETPSEPAKRGPGRPKKAE